MLSPHRREHLPSGLPPFSTLQQHFANGPRAPLQNLDIDHTHPPQPHHRCVRHIQVYRSFTHQSAPIVLHNVGAPCFLHPKTRSNGQPTPVRSRRRHIAPEAEPAPDGVLNPARLCVSVRCRTNLHSAWSVRLPHGCNFGAAAQKEEKKPRHPSRHS